MFAVLTVLFGVVFCQRPGDSTSYRTQETVVYFMASKSACGSAAERAEEAAVLLGALGTVLGLLVVLLALIVVSAGISETLLRVFSVALLGVLAVALLRVLLVVAVLGLAVVITVAHVERVLDCVLGVVVELNCLL